MSLDLPTIYILPTNMQPEELQSLEDQTPSLTWDIHEAELILGRISRRERALFELRRLKVPTEELLPPHITHAHDAGEPSQKRRRIASDKQSASLAGRDAAASAAMSTTDAHELKRSGDTIKVLKLSWLTDSLEKGIALPFGNYILYEGRRLRSTEQPETHSSHGATSPGGALARVVVKPMPPPANERAVSRAGRRGHHSRDRGAAYPPAALIHQTTSDHDVQLPPIPAFLQTTYSCQRPTPVNPPNAGFVEALKEVRTLRQLEGDEVGVRAYASSIASVSAYPFTLRTPREVARLPGCGAKIAELFHQWRDIGNLQEIVCASADERLSTLKLFYDIWGVGDTTAREFYNKGWRDIDDLVEHGWDQLSRVQQIGVKYYDEFLLGIPRDEVEHIGSTILSHARQADAGFQLTIVGGYRRGKARSGDVDVVVSHRDEALTMRCVERLVISLEKSKHITHTLTLSLRNSERDQTPLAWKGEGGRGSGFDTLDKALVVWKDPHNKAAHHRRVDIIVSPWKTVGCAVLGWSGATTFQRDLRRYCKKEKGLKFDSSGIRSRTDGAWVDFEGSGTAPDMEAAEKRVFDGLGLAWRPPEERCTG